MTRKDYQMIAEAIRDARNEIAGDEPHSDVRLAHFGMRKVADYIAADLGERDLHFDRSRFLKACGFDA